MRVAYFLAILLGLCACGQKGPLYLPADKPSQMSEVQKVVIDVPTSTENQSTEVSQ